MKSVCIIVGSLREKSFNRQLAREVEQLLGSRVAVSYLEWKDLPLMDQDIELPAPAQVQRVRDQIVAADGIWICSPEYNFNIPGGLKNALDWLSRPVDPRDQSSVSVMKGKVVAISGAGGRFATGGMRGKMKELLGFMGMEIVGDEGFGFALAPEMWATDVLTLDDEAREQLGALVDAFVSRVVA